MRRITETLLLAAAIATVAAALVVAGCGSCPGPPAEVAPATVEEPEPAAEPAVEEPVAEPVEAEEPVDGGPSAHPDEDDTAMASEGEGD